MNGSSFLSVFAQSEQNKQLEDVMLNGTSVLALEPVSDKSHRL